MLQQLPVALIEKAGYPFVISTDYLFDKTSTRDCRLWTPGHVGQGADDVTNEMELLRLGN